MKNILIIDDDPDMRQALRVVLEAKYGILEASGRDEAYQSLTGAPPSLIILDVMMDTPSTGFELAREFKGDRRLSAVKILMLTSVDAATNIDFKSSAGDPDWLPVDGYLSKPIDPRLLLQKVDSLIA